MDSVGVLFVWRGLGNAGGGVERFLVQCLKHLPAFGFDPYIMNVTGKPFGIDLIPYSQRVIPLACGTIWANGVWARLKLANIRLVVVNEPVHLAIVPQLPRPLPVLAIFHTDHPSPDYYGQARRLSHRIAEFIGVSDVIVAKLRTALGPLADTRKILYGIDHVRPRRGGSEPGVRIVYLGRLVHDQKRIMDIVPFVKELEALNVNYTLSIIGDGEEKGVLKRKLERLDIGRRVNLFGALPHREAMMRLSEADVLVLFSEFEGLPICLLEAFSCSVVPVVTRIQSGISEVLEDNRNARLFEVGRPRQAARIIKLFADDVELLNKLKSAARETATRFSVEETMQSYANLFNDVLSRNPRAQRSWDWRNTWRKRAGQGAKTLIRQVAPRAAITAAQTLANVVNRYG
jgi:glycosyltransferase involved in cell wall biosynthesis